MGESTYTVERSTTVHADAERVFAELVDFRRWPRWSPWEDLDPAMRRTYAGPEEGIGSVYTWSGNRKAGEGRMEITDVRTPSRLVVDLQFLKPFRSHSTTVFTLEPADAGTTRVTWTMTGSRTLAVRVMGVFTSMDKLVGGDFEKGLARLAAVVGA